MYNLIFTIVPHNSGELITAAVNKAGAGGSTVLMGRGTAASSLAQLFGFGDSQKDVVYTVIPSDLKNGVLNEIKEASKNKKQPFGIFFTVSVQDFLKGGKNLNTQGDKTMEDTAAYKMINVIVNKGFADDAMAAARKAGAGGGTIFNARGTAREGDAKFFGMEIVPEKEMLMILSPAEKAQAVVQAIQALPCLSKAGSGIITILDARDFTILGKSK